MLTEIPNDTKTLMGSDVFIYQIYYLTVIVAI